MFIRSADVQPSQVINWGIAIRALYRNQNHPVQNPWGLNCVKDSLICRYAKLSAFVRIYWNADRYQCTKIPAKIHKVIKIPSICYIIWVLVYEKPEKGKGKMGKNMLRLLLENTNRGGV